MKAKCAHCGKIFEIQTGHYNRAMKVSGRVFCNRRHAGMGRRRSVTKEELKREKYFYDAFRSLCEADVLKPKRAAYFQKDYAANPEKYKKIREDRREMHNEYCRQPKYKEYKHQYDVERHHKSMYGDFWEASIILSQIEKEIDNRIVKQQNGLINKSQKRKRLWQKIQAKESLNSLLKI